MSRSSVRVALASVPFFRCAAGTFTSFASKPPTSVQPISSTSANHGQVFVTLAVDGKECEGLHGRNLPLGSKLVFLSAALRKDSIGEVPRVVHEPLGNLESEQPGGVEAKWYAESVSTIYSSAFLKNINYNSVIDLIMTIASRINY